MRDKIWEILNKTAESLTKEEFDMLIKYITYEAIEEWQNMTGEAIDIDGITIEERNIVTAAAFLEFLKEN